MLLQDGRKASSAGRCRRTLRPPLRVRDDTCNRGLHAYGVNEIEGLGPCQSALFIPRARACFRCAWRALTISTTHSAYQTRPARPRHALTRSRTLAGFRHRQSTCLSSAISPRVVRARRCLGQPSLLRFDAHTRLCGVSFGDLGLRLDLCARVGSAHAGGAVQRAIWACRSGYEWTASINVLQVYHIEYRLPLGTLVQCLKA